MRAYGGPRYQVTQQVMGRFAEAIEQAKVEVVPRVLVTGGTGAQGQSNVFETLLAMLMSDKIGEAAVTGSGSPRAPQMETFRNRVKDGLLAELQNGKA